MLVRVSDASNHGLDSESMRWIPTVEVYTIHCIVYALSFTLWKPFVGEILSRERVQKRKEKRSQRLSEFSEFLLMLFLYSRLNVDASGQCGARCNRYCE